MSCRAAVSSGSHLSSGVVLTDEPRDYVEAVLWSKALIGLQLAVSMAVFWSQATSAGLW